MKSYKLNINIKIKEAELSIGQGAFKKVLIKHLQAYFALSILCMTSLANAAPGEAATSLSSRCSVLAPSSFTVPDRIKGEEVGFRESILANDKTPLSPILKIGAYKKNDFSFVTYAKTLPTFPIIQPSLDNPALEEVPNNNIKAETRYVIGGGNSANEVCVYSYQIFQVAGQYIRTSLATVEVKLAEPKVKE